MESDPAADGGTALTCKVIGLAIAVHRKLGPAMLESVHEECLCDEHAQPGLSFERQHPISVSYPGLPVGIGFRIDMLVARELVVEGKALCEQLREQVQNVE